MTSTTVTTPTPPPITLAIHAVGQDARAALIADVREGLARTPKELPSRWFYDERGSALFDEITRLPEYYQTRTEAAILREVAPAVVERVRPIAIVELGSGTSTKTRILLDAARRQGDLAFFVPFDISASTISQAAHQLIEEYPGLSVHGVVGDFHEHLGRIPHLGRQLVVFLGSTIGNFDEAERAVFLGALRELLRDGDALLLGVDLVKDRDELVRAYDDSQGVTAAFNRNVLAVINRELDADFDLDAFDHVALYDEGRARIEMHLRSRRRQTVQIPAASLRVDFAEGEMLRTEISAKFTRPAVEALFSGAGLRLERWMTDPGGKFALALGVPA